MKTTTSAFTHVGQRQHNEDAHILLPAHELFLVADGMGGHSSGERASALAKETIGGFFKLHAHQATLKWPQPTDKASSPRQALLEVAIKQANKAIFERSTTDHTCRGMGTTIAALTFEGDEAIIAHVGDSRVYLMRDGALTQLTQDHSLYNEFLAAGAPDMPAPQDFIYRNVITKALGIKEEVEVSVQRMQAQAGDVFLLCSDGLTEQLDHARLELLMQHHHDELAQSLVMAALEADTSDNTTAIVVRCT